MCSVGPHAGSVVFFPGTNARMVVMSSINTQNPPQYNYNSQSSASTTSTGAPQPQPNPQTDQLTKGSTGGTGAGAAGGSLTLPSGEGGQSIQAIQQEIEQLQTQLASASSPQAAQQIQQQQLALMQQEQTAMASGSGAGGAGGAGATGGGGAAGGTTGGAGATGAGAGGGGAGGTMGGAGGTGAGSPASNLQQKSATTGGAGSTGAGSTSGSSSTGGGAGSTGAGAAGGTGGTTSGSSAGGVPSYLAGSAKLDPSYRNGPYKEYADAIEYAAGQTGISANLLGAMVADESQGVSGNKNPLQADVAASGDGSLNAAMLAGAQQLLFDDKTVQQQHGVSGSLGLALRAYNSGPYAGTDPNNLNSIKSTGRPEYVQKVTDYLQKIEGGGGASLPF